MESGNRGLSLVFDVPPHTAILGLGRSSASRIAHPPRHDRGAGTSEGVAPTVGATSPISTVPDDPGPRIVEPRAKLLQAPFFPGFPGWQSSRGSDRPFRAHFARACRTASSANSRRSLRKRLSSAISLALLALGERNRPPGACPDAPCDPLVAARDATDCRAGWRCRPSGGRGWRVANSFAESPIVASIRKPSSFDPIPTLPLGRSGRSKTPAALATSAPSEVARDC